jgi:CPA2 family monovalent cation:H+ antiporter-2
MDDQALGVSALQKMPLFAGVNRHDLVNIVKLGALRTFEPEQNIVERDEPGDAMYVILRGNVQVEAGGRRHELKPGDFFGEMALLTGRRRMATVKAADQVVTLRIGAEEFQGFLLQHSPVAVAVLKSLVERLREVQERIES